MYLIVMGKMNGDVHYFGPFPTNDRAMEYGKAIDRDYVGARWHVAHLAVPFVTVVQNIEWVK